MFQQPPTALQLSHNEFDKLHAQHFSTDDRISRRLPYSGTRTSHSIHRTVKTKSSIIYDLLQYETEATLLFPN